MISTLDQLLDITDALEVVETSLRSRSDSSIAPETSAAIAELPGALQRALVTDFLHPTCSHELTAIHAVLLEDIRHQTELLVSLLEARDDAR